MRKLSDKYFPAARWTSEITVQAREGNAEGKF